MQSARRNRVSLTAQPGRAPGGKPALPTWLGVILLFCGVLLAATTGLRPLPVAAQSAGQPAAAPEASGLAADDIDQALDQFDALSRLFAAFAERERNGIASERWRLLSVNYAGTAEILRGLLAARLVVIDDLPAGRSSGLLDDGRIVLDSSLDGVWLAALPQAAASEEVSQAAVLDILVPALMEGLARGLRPRDWPWLADHLAALGGLDALAEQAAARPLLARYFRAKDAYLWLAMQRIAEGDPARRRNLARRQVEIFRGIRGLRGEFEATFGAADAERLRDDWSGYVALVDGFAATRGWLLLDPTLRLTQLGAAARAEFDAVELAAAEVMASAPRTAIAAAMVEGRRRPPVVPPQSAPIPAPITLDAIVPPAQAPGPPDRAAEQVADLAAALPLLALALQPEYSVAAGGPAETAELAARFRAALAQPDPRLQRDAQAEALTAARRELSALQAQVKELNAALEARAAAVTPAAGPGAAAVAPLTSAAGGSAAWPASVQNQPWQLYLLLAAGGGLVFGLLLWRRQRRAAPAAASPPLLLAAPGAEAALALAPAAVKPEPPAAPAAEPPPPAAAQPSPAAAPPPPKRPASASVPRPTLPPLATVDSVAGRRVVQAEVPLRVSGIQPATAVGQAALKAATAQIAALGRAEAEVATHPIVQALRNGNLPLFELLFSELTDLRSPQLQRIVYGGRGEDLLIVCRAVGVDKLLFGSIFLLTDHLRGGDANEDPARVAEVLRMFDRMPPPTAQKVLAKWQRNWGGRERTRPPAGV